MIEKLKTVEIASLSKDAVLEHKKNVLGLDNKDMIVEYLKFAIDTFYKTEEEGDNSEIVEMFFKSEEFAPFYDEILNANESEE